MKRNDVILIACLLIICGLLFAGMKFWQKRNTDADAYVEVKVDGEVYATYPLNEDRVERIEYDNGCYNVLEIKDGKANVTEASCPDQICVRHKAIHYSDETIVCLPNKLTITVVGGNQNQIDATTNQANRSSIKGPVTLHLYVKLGYTQTGLVNNI